GGGRGAAVEAEVSLRRQRRGAVGAGASVGRHWAPESRVEMSWEQQRRNGGKGGMASDCSSPAGKPASRQRRPVNRTGDRCRSRRARRGLAPTGSVESNFQEGSPSASPSRGFTRELARCVASG